MFIKVATRILTPWGFVILGVALLTCGCPFGILLVAASPCLL